jgi:hypothetical protein
MGIDDKRRLTKQDISELEQLARMGVQFIQIKMEEPPNRRPNSLLWSITGTYNDTLAFNKFAAFALVSALLVPTAAKQFRSALQDERFSRNNRQRSQRVSQRNRDSATRFNFRLNRLTAALLKSLRPERHEGGSIFPAPHWVGEARPKGARSVRLRSNFPSSDYLRYLVSDLGYDGSAAIAALSRAHQPWARVSDRRTSAETNGLGNLSFSPAHPYHPASPTERATRGGGLKKDKVTEAIAQHNWDDKLSTAVFEIVYLRRKPSLVAASLGLKTATVYQYCSRVRADLHAEQAPKEQLEGADWDAENPNPFVFSECV